MSTDYHTAIPTNAPANASTFNAPLGQLDAGIGGILTGSQPFSKISFNAATTLTIASGSVTPTLGLHLIAAQSGTTDDLDTITAVNNSFLFIKADSGDTITLTSGGNLNADDIILSGNNVILLFCQNGQWSIVNTPVSEKPLRGYVFGLEVTTINATTTVTVSPGLCADDLAETTIEITSPTNIDLAGTGINALDTGTIANDTFYYVFAVKGSSGSGVIASTSFAGPTLPAGYDLWKRRIATFKTNGSAAPYSTYMPRGQMGARRVYYREVTNASPYRILDTVNLGTSGAQTTVDCSALVPVTADTVIAQISINTPDGAVEVYWNANDTRNRFLMNLPATGMISTTMFDLELATFIGSTATGRLYGSASQDEDLSFYVFGYIDNVLFIGI